MTVLQILLKIWQSIPIRVGLFFLLGGGGGGGGEGGYSDIFIHT